MFFGGGRFEDSGGNYIGRFYGFDTFIEPRIQKRSNYMSYSLNSLKGVRYGIV